MDKWSAFIYGTNLLTQWGKEHSIESSSFSRLKMLKLLFFYSAVEANSNNLGLLDVFDKYYAMPYGHVEGEIYGYIVEGNIHNASQLPACREVLLDIDRIRIDKSILALRKANDKIISYSAMQLVDLSHQWHSWQSAYQVAKLMKKGSESIKISTIQNEVKIFTL